MSDVTLTYGSTGFEKTQGELSSLQTHLGKVPEWARPAQTVLSELGSKGSQAFRQIGSGAQEAAGHILGFIGHMAKLTTIVAAVNGLLGGLGVYAFGRWAEGMLKATEANRGLEASLFGVLRSQAAVTKVMDFAEEYSKKSIATAHEVKEVMAGLAYQPAIRPILQGADISGMRQMMDIVTGLARMRPQEGLQGAMHAFSQVLSGQFMGLQRSWGIRPEFVAAAGGMTPEAMGTSSQNIMKGLQAFISGSVTGTGIGFDAMMRKLKDSYSDFLRALGDTGI